MNYNLESLLQFKLEYSKILTTTLTLWGRSLQRSKIQVKNLAINVLVKELGKFWTALQLMSYYSNFGNFDSLMYKYKKWKYAAWNQLTNPYEKY